MSIVTDVKNIIEANKQEYGDWALKALTSTAERIEGKHIGKFTEFDAGKLIDVFEATYPGQYDLICEIIEGVSREQLPELAMVFQLELANQLTMED